MIERPPPSWDDVLSQIEKLRTLAVHLKAESPTPADFLPLFRLMSEFVLEAASDVGDEARDRATVLINAILIEHGYTAYAERQT